MTTLPDILATYRGHSQTEREKGTYFEKLTRTFFKNEGRFRELYRDVQLFGDWAKQHGHNAQDAGIDLVATPKASPEGPDGPFHAIQCKNFAPEATLRKEDIDSFFTASGKKHFSLRYVVATTNKWSHHAEEAMAGQGVPVQKIDLHTLETSQIDWSRFDPKHPDSQPALKEKKTLRKHQVEAHKDVLAGLKRADRGKLIMACGTGKTFTALKITEAQVKPGGRVLFLVPSLALLQQTLTEWTQETATPLRSFAVCSDSDIGNRRAVPGTKKSEVSEQGLDVLIHELAYPATTNAKRLGLEAGPAGDPKGITAVFSTYHSLGVVSAAQHEHGLPPFDLVICDEAHRTTGATFEGDDDSSFVRVHDTEYLRADKRLYMTATPRIYSPAAKATDDVDVYSMDDEPTYGERFHLITFGDAVRQGLLCDYKVVVLSVDAAYISRRLQALLADGTNQLKVDDAARIVGCWKALAKHGLAVDNADDTDPMQRAVAFCQRIEPDQSGKGGHKVSSKLIANLFEEVVAAYRDAEIEAAKTSEEADAVPALECVAKHVDGTMNAGEKTEKIDWLKADPGEDACRILTNVRCLSEGVDVPALDAVLFLSPRNSQVEVVQSVGRVMRAAPGKKRGYVILPVVIPEGVEPHTALDNNGPYRAVWEVLQALRSHDESFDGMINRSDLNGKLDERKIEIVAVTDAKPQKKREKQSATQAAKKSHNLANDPGVKTQTQTHTQTEIPFAVGEIEKALYAKIVQKCGNRRHWEEWADDIADIAKTHITRIRAIVVNRGNVAEKAAFDAFAAELRDDLNDAITDEEVIEMLAQHLITRPVFDALFENYSFAKNNPVSTAMQGVLDVLHEHHLEKETDTLKKFYESVRLRASGITNAAGRQKVIVELYDKFFRNAFPRMTDRLGLVYTPVEVVDFIVHSVHDLLKSEFGLEDGIGTEGVHVLDPFTGTGTFLTRLLSSGLIPPNKLAHKYRHELHANEIVLLAYYIAAINIEATYRDVSLDLWTEDAAAQTEEYEPFGGICLTDTFQLHEADDLISDALAANSDRRKRQKELDIRVILGNPPYSAGQTSQNDNNQNVEYPLLDQRIRSTYGRHSQATLQRNLFDSYIRAIRWASDRIGTDGDGGVIGFVTNAGFLDSGSADGLRRCLAEEFSSIHVFHLRGNQRTSGERSRAEGGKIFGSGSRAPIAITLLVKNPSAAEHGRILWHDIGDYLDTEQKLEIVRGFGSVRGIDDAEGWTQIVPDEHHDWVDQRDSGFDGHMPLGAKKTDEAPLFSTYSLGVCTNRDAWVHNFSKEKMSKNVAAMIDNYNAEVARFLEAGVAAPSTASVISSFVNDDPKKISWSRGLKGRLAKGERLRLADRAAISLYRPFSKQWLYFDRDLNEGIGRIPRFFPDPSADNQVIVVSGVGASKGFTALMSDSITSLDMVEKGQGFPLWQYLPEEEHGRNDDGTLMREPGVDHQALAAWANRYPDIEVDHSDIFYYVYGILHSPDYRERFAANLKKEMPRIPAVASPDDFMAFSKAGRRLADLHVGYETVDPYPAELVLKKGRTLASLTPDELRVVKMKYKKKGDPTTIVYNPHVTVTGIPPEAQRYVVNGKSAIDWVIDRQQVKTDKKSGIANDPNDWATGTMNDPRYPLDLLLRVITVSLETMKVVDALPALQISS